MNGSVAVLGAVGALALAGGLRRGSRATLSGVPASILRDDLSPDMVTLLGDFMEERYGSDRGEAPEVPARLPLRTMAVEPLYRSVMHDAWDDRGPAHVSAFVEEMARRVPAPDRTNPEAVARHLLGPVPYREWVRGAWRPRPNPGPAIPPIVTWDGGFADGRHRLFAAHQLGITHLPAIEMADLAPQGALNQSPIHWVDTGFGETQIGPTTLQWEALGPHEVRLGSVRTPSRHRRKGAARHALNVWLSEADRHGATVTLLASPLDRATSRGRLVRFYASLGFSPTGRTGNPAGDPWMRRTPQAGSRAIEPGLVDEVSRGPLRVRSQFFSEGMSIAAYGSARAVRKKVAEEFVMIVKSFTKDRTLCAKWVPPALDDFYRDHRIQPTDRAVYLDLVRLPATGRGRGLGRAMVERILDRARGEGAHVALLISKHFEGSERPLEFWVRMGFVPLADAPELDAAVLGRGKAIEPGDVVLMARAL